MYVLKILVIIARYVRNSELQMCRWKMVNKFSVWEVYLRSVECGDENVPRWNERYREIYRLNCRGARSVKNAAGPVSSLPQR